MGLKNLYIPLPEHLYDREVDFNLSYNCYKINEVVYPINLEKYEKAKYWTSETFKTSILVTLFEEKNVLK